MTAEIAIFNKSAVALAADSAVTVGFGDRRAKIYNSANKLFTLSKYAPVGVMIFGAADYKGIPWETLIKMYRHKLATKTYNKLSDYGKNFVEFLDKQKKVFPKDEHEGYFYRFISGEYVLIKKDIEAKVTKHIETNKSIDEITNQHIVDSCIQTSLNNIKQRYKIDGEIPEDNEDIKKLAEIIQRAIATVFEKQAITADGAAKLKSIAKLIYIVWADKTSWTAGVVIAGFGEDELFPSYEVFQVNAFIDNKLRRDRGNEINFDTTAMIVPFAQADMVHSFMSGINPAYKGQIVTYFNKLIKDLPSVIADCAPLPDNEKQVFLEKVKNGFDKVINDFGESFKQYESEKHSGPIIDMVTSLPKDELANMAESLVNLTSFKRKISREDETVGGPIDVAVISKWDGFIWIKRKHYFQSEFNYSFFNNYYQKRKKHGGKDESTEEAGIPNN